MVGVHSYSDSSGRTDYFYGGVSWKHEQDRAGNLLVLLMRTCFETLSGSTNQEPRSAPGWKRGQGVRGNVAKPIEYTVLHTNRGCGKKEAHVNCPCAGGLSAVNAIGTQLRDPIDSGLTRWRMAV